MKVFAVREQNSEVFVTEDLNMAVHEMVSIIHGRMRSIFDSGYSVTQLKLDDVVVEEYVPQSGKRYRYVTNKIRFDTRTCSVVASKDCSEVFSALYCCQDLINEIKGFVNAYKPAERSYQPNNLTSTATHTVMPTVMPTVAHTVMPTVAHTVMPTVAHTVIPAASKSSSSNKFGEILNESTDLINKTMNTLSESIKNKPLIEIVKQKNQKPKNVKIRDGDDVKSDISDIADLISDDDNDVVDTKLDKVKKQIDDLNRLKNQGKEKVKDLTESHEKQKNNLMDYSADVNYVKKKMYLEKENETERRRIFNADKKAYFKMKEDLEKGKLKKDKVSPLFVDKFKLFEYLDTKDVLGKVDEDDMTNDESVDEDYFVYSELIKGKPKETHFGFVPHNYYYLSDNEQKKFSPSVNKRKDIIDEFMDKNKIKPLQKILDELSEDDDVDDRGHDDDDDDSVPDIKTSKKADETIPDIDASDYSKKQQSSTNETSKVKEESGMTKKPYRFTGNQDDDRHTTPSVFESSDKISDYDYGKISETVSRFRGMFN
jgi:hypothetical protein